MQNMENVILTIIKDRFDELACDIHLAEANCVEIRIGGRQFTVSVSESCSQRKIS